MANFLATSNVPGELRPVEYCWIQLGGGKDDRLTLYALPELSDSKTVEYSDQSIHGRAAPVKTYSMSSNRTIGLVIHLYVTRTDEVTRNLDMIRKIAALAHPEYDGTYLPPRIAKIKCGNLLTDRPDGVPVVLKSYNVQYDTDIQWFFDEKTSTYMPLHVSIDTQWDVVYSWLADPARGGLPGYADVLLGHY